MSDQKKIALDRFLARRATELVQLPQAAREERIQLWRQTDYEASLETLEKPRRSPKKLPKRWREWVRAAGAGSLRLGGPS